MNTKLLIYSWGIALSTAIVSAQSPSSSPAGAVVPITVDNFIRAESDRYFGNRVKQGGFGKLFHLREPMPIEQQPVIRGNRDTLYSSGVFDLDAGPVTVTLPNAGTRYMSLMTINEDEYSPQLMYEARDYTFTREQVGTRYVMIATRTLFDPTKKGDIDEAHALQDAIKTSQSGGPGKFEILNWDQTSLNQLRNALLILARTVPDSRRMFGLPDQVDPIRHLLGAACAWGGNNEKDALYLNRYPSRNDGKTVYKLRVKDVPVDAFWSISLYNGEGYFQKNAQNSYTVNSLTAVKSDDSLVTVQFGGCDGKIPNCLPIMPGWNYMVRLYRPRPEILNGSWKFPEAQPVK